MDCPKDIHAKSIITVCCQMHLAKQLDLKDKDLEYLGFQVVNHGILIMFSVLREDHKFYGSTRSVAVSDKWEPRYVGAPI